MITNFLRPPRTLGEWAADGIRVLGLVSVVVAAIGWQVTDAGVLAFALPALCVPRFLGMRPSADIVTGVVVLVAAWSNVIDLYTTVPDWDLLLHFAGTGVLTVCAMLALARFGALPAPRSADATAAGTVVVAVAVGLALSAVWEMVEWAGWLFISDEIFVGYQDTIGDMAIGGVGAAVAGLVLTRVRVLRADAA